MMDSKVDSIENHDSTVLYRNRSGSMSSHSSEQGDNKVSVEELAMYLDVQLHIPHEQQQLQQRQQQQQQQNQCISRKDEDGKITSSSQNIIPSHSTSKSFPNFRVDSEPSVSCLQDQRTLPMTPAVDCFEVIHHTNDLIVGENDPFLTAAAKTASSFSPTAPKCANMRKRAEPEITVEELAGYFDLQLHIPRKMSYMAELMYT
ncbi:uncharacterized protein LOC141852556 [Brevipalpus obovatus]|uniref:uncharacterized protein LOC141852556 n=1 Tax=Brevipalpus obovatus TaxID=246614 RepID=UPI003D9F1E9C